MNGQCKTHYSVLGSITNIQIISDIMLNIPYFQESVDLQIDSSMFTNNARDETNAERTSIGFVS